VEAIRKADLKREIKDVKKQLKTSEEVVASNFLSRAQNR
jgi:hypothetical protein